VKRRAGLVLVLLCLLAAPERGTAWDMQGHMMVAAIAWPLMSDAAKRQANDLLKLNSEYGSWVKGISPAQRGRRAFILASAWPDVIKREGSGYVFDGQRPTGEEALRNIGYADHLQHRYWHYIDLPFSTDGTPLIEPAEPNALTQIALFRQTVRPDSGLNDSIRSYDLVWLIHLVGDIHQPLHAASRFTQEQPNGDAGGSDVKLAQGPDKNLHEFWDTVLGTSEDPVIAANAVRSAKFPWPPPKTQAAVTDENAWAEESLRIAETEVYTPPIGAGAGPYVLTPVYARRAYRIAQERIALAGARLARLLDSSLAP
jgi:hypothetical protein